MRRLTSRRWWVAAVLSLVIGGCGDDPPTQPPSPSGLTVSSVTPSSGPTGIATAIRINGTGFESGATVTLDGAAVPSSRLSSVAIAATAPAHAAGPIDIVVTNPGGTRSLLTRGFTYVAQLTGLVVGGPTALTAVGQTTQLTATAAYADGTTLDVTRDTLWTVSSIRVATVSGDGVLTANSLGATYVVARHPIVRPSQFRTARVVITPPGTFAAAGRTREPGEGGIGDVRVLHVASGVETVTDADGLYSFGGLSGDPRLSFTKADYETTEATISMDADSDVPMQRVNRLVAGEAPRPFRMAPNDIEYVLTGQTRCQPCRMFRVTSPTPGTVQLKVTWTDASTLLTAWIGGRDYPGDAAARELVADLPIGSTEIVVFIGSSRVPPPGSYLPFTVAVGAPQSVR